MNKLPVELHLIKGTKGEHNPITLPEKVKQRIPQAEWMDNPDAWDKAQFVKETSDFLFEVYGIGTSQDKHTLTMLADQIELYIQCNRGIAKNGVISKFNDNKTIGPNPFITVRNNALKLIIQLMNELGLTPRSRLSSGKTEENSSVAKFLRGPKG
jgi:P27 family predicted phage terminase small subunit